MGEMVLKDQNGHFKGMFIYILFLKQFKYNL